MSKTLQIRVTDDQMEMMELLAEKRGVSVSEVARQVIFAGTDQTAVAEVEKLSKQVKALLRWRREVKKGA